MKKYFQIAIDGPVAAGKGAVAKLLAEKLKFLYVDTGAMYRAAVLLALQAGIRLDNEPGISRLVEKANFEMRKPTEIEADGRLSTVIVNGKDISWKIRDKRISDKVAQVSGLPKVREALVAKQRQIAEKRDVIMEGRDIASVVLPEAQLKIFLDAREEVRVERRFRELKALKIDIRRKEVEENVSKRDRMDKQRSASPLKIVKDAWYINTSNLTDGEVAGMIVRKVTSLRSKEKQDS